MFLLLFLAWLETRDEGDILISSKDLSQSLNVKFLFNFVSSLQENQDMVRAELETNTLQKQTQTHHSWNKNCNNTILSVISPDIEMRKRKERRKEGNSWREDEEEGMKDAKQDAITNKEEEEEEDEEDESNTCPLTSASIVVTWAVFEKSVTIPGKKYPKSGSNHTRSPFEGKGYWWRW